MLNILLSINLRKNCHKCMNNLLYNKKKIELS